MCCFFTVTICIVIATGSVGDNGIVMLKGGEDFSICIRTSEPKMVSLRKETQEIFVFCSPEEQNHGCKPRDSTRFSHQIHKENFSVTFLDASTSDEGLYIVEVIDEKNKRIQHNYSVSLQQLPHSINPETPSIHPFSTPATSTKGEKTFGTNSFDPKTFGPITTVSTERNRKITGGSIGLLGLIAAIVTGIIYCKKKQYEIVDDDTENPGKGISLNSNTNGAGEPATDGPFEIVVQSDGSVDDKNKAVHGA